MITLIRAILSDKSDDFRIASVLEAIFIDMPLIALLVWLISSIPVW
jgi:hypothetical protein